MNHERISVLLLGESSYHLQGFMEQRGCQCRFAGSAEEGIRLFHEREFELVLSSNALAQALGMVGDVTGSSCNIFHAHPVQDGCWWLTIMRNGRNCIGAAAVRPREFAGLLDQILKEVREKHLAVAKVLIEVTCGDSRLSKIAS